MLMIFSMAGQKENLSHMWQVLRKSLTLEDAVASVSNTYLGCNQRNITIDNLIVDEKNNMFSRLITPVQGTTLEEDKRDAQQSFDDSQVLTDPTPSSSQTGGVKMTKPGTLAPGDQPSQSFSKKKNAKSSAQKPSQATVANTLSARARVLTTMVKKQGLFTGPIKAWVYDMKEHTEQCIDRVIKGYIV